MFPTHYTGSVGPPEERAALCSEAGIGWNELSERSRSHLLALLTPQDARTSRLHLRVEPQQLSVAMGPPPLRPARLEVRPRIEPPAE